MSFASWRKCDFQIHTPRDPAWVGVRTVGLGEPTKGTGAPATAQDVDVARKQWANEFLDQCFAGGLNAIALTDHHEMVFVPYVQQAIAERKAADAQFDFWLFPGMELTAAGGKQCLIIFDADISEDWRRQAQGKLGIVYADLDEKHAKGPKVTQLASHYADIGAELDKLEGLRGKYIVLPNVSQGNSHTVLTDGGHADFRRMPYVGGYLDQGQTHSTLGSKNQKRLSGLDKTWCTREIFPLPTSDSRSADFSMVGSNSTWIKLAAPTAEAIRQAFLGHKSRITIKPPQLPSLVVSEIEIDGSAILEKTKFPFSPEFNSVIGGRGSGKSSFLEYVSFGLGRSCYDVERDHYSGTQRMRDLINDTLIAKGARVKLTVTQDNAAFEIVRGPATAFQPTITYPNGSKQTATVKELRALFPAVVYSQGELAEIGKQAGKKTQLSDLLQFVNPDYKREDDRLTLDIEAAKVTVKGGVQSLAAHWILQSQLRKLTTTKASLTQRVEALEKTLPALSEEDQSIVAYFDKANDFESKRLQASKHADQIVEELDKSITELVNERDLATDLADDSAAIRKGYGELFSTFSAGIKQFKSDMRAKRSTLAAAETEWAANFKVARTARDEVLEKLGAHRTATSQIIKLREEITDLTNQIGDLDAKIKANGDPAAGLDEKLVALRALNDRRTERTQEWAKEIERLSNGKIKAIVDAAGDVSEIKDAVDLLANKTGSQEATRLKELDDAVAKDTPIAFLDKMRADSLSLLYWRQIGAASGEKQPDSAVLFGVLGDTDRIRAALSEKLDTTRVETVAAALPKPMITLSYSDGAKEIAFEKASEGQRAAALLFMLLEQPGGPLIIDQPEGDLDNRIIAELTDKLHTAKQNRQLIFASHNANIVVNGSSELVGHLDVKDTGERQFECAGAIDTPSICKVITSTMEGGEKAFKDRQNKYGY
ncbi:AAA family ATPase [Mesorhizobium sp. M1307]|uniref:TrlF family AAA-like ATPase n=1 Tax=unclassified Mesorhizobium TaxID=325217 RepID=UPI00333B2D08